MSETAPITRRVDDLGRVVIPKTVRKEADIGEGDTVEFRVTPEGILPVKVAAAE